MISGEQVIRLERTQILEVNRTQHQNLRFSPATLDFQARGSNAGSRAIAALPSERQTNPIISARICSPPVSRDQWHVLIAKHQSLCRINDFRCDAFPIGNVDRDGRWETCTMGCRVRAFS